MQKLMVDDEVIVLAGKDKGKTGKIVSLQVRHGRRVVTVGKINMVRKGRQQGQNEGPDFVDVERPLDISNVALVSPKTKKATRVRIERRDKKNVRVAVACGSVLKQKGKV